MQLAKIPKKGIDYPVVTVRIKRIHNYLFLIFSKVLLIQFIFIFDNFIVAGRFSKYRIQCIHHNLFGIQFFVEFIIPFENQLTLDQVNILLLIHFFFKSNLIHFFISIKKLLIMINFLL